MAALLNSPGGYFEVLLMELLLKSKKRDEGYLPVKTSDGRLNDLLLYRVEVSFGLYTLLVGQMRLDSSGPHEEMTHEAESQPS